MTTPRYKRCPSGDAGHLVGLKADDRYCWKCGAELVEAPLPVCACGNILGRHDRYCTACGRQAAAVFVDGAR